jgi:GntR family transcriptional regulator
VLLALRPMTPYKYDRRGKLLAVRTRIAGNIGVTRYLQLYTMLSQALTDGRIAAGSALPSEPELVREYQVSRTTVRRALARLENENRIVRRRGSGTYARTPKAEQTLHLKQSNVLADSKFLAQHTKGRLIDYQRITTPELVRRFSPELGETALRIRCVRDFEKVPLLLAVGYVPERLTGGLNKRTVGQKALVTCLHDLGARPSGGDQFISAIGADAFVAKHLKVDINSPLIHARLTLRDSQDRIVTHEEVFLRPERVELQTAMQVR